ncbi:phosphatidylinositol-3,5-bisphosphate binding protein HSV2 KNAG_0A01620 [Huiozyma naganishii CBS 8797]|uniref:SVP1-like protein 2 n=1 Tax=Huiozyma naganishii (strain ATCC MYA-139 / BCRC 22969 / CBS 8797 / KCTC 17520 / NBRC 10181 / NCYC 3082 / Yp74L-3) TaxID=1071383 RepID=J7S382_HUIN7|nr:hypothetical protein KNAG_0A01620 [Kazachstania naganishii CBS 8797]CCK67851.1 hypothetical protein KNAG_0A01620 [Kazachstania naganishii CBS 8797]
MVATPEAPKYTAVSFNRDDSCFCCCHSTGFQVFNTDPLQSKIENVFSGSVGRAKLLNRSNYIALIGGDGSKPAFPLNKLIIWDDLLQKETLKLSFMSLVQDVFLTRLYIVAQVDGALCVYRFKSYPQRVGSDIPTSRGSPVGFQMNGKNQGILVYESATHPGQLHVATLETKDTDVGDSVFFPTTIIKAHKTTVRLVKLNRQSTLLATSSVKGTVIRVFNVTNGTLVNEFRRGSDPAEIYAMSFNPSGDKLCVVSNKQTLHIYQLGGGSNGQQEANRRHAFQGLVPQFKYLQSKWSMCSSHLYNPTLHMQERYDRSDRCSVGWCNENNDTVVLVWHNLGIYERYVIMKEPNPTKGKEYEEKWQIVRESWRDLSP